MSKYKIIYHQRAKLGLCVRCGKQPEERKKLCEVCSLENKIRCRDRLCKKKKAGICTACGFRIMVSKSRCQECLDKFNKYRESKKIEAYNKLGGCICKCCGETEIDFLSIDHVQNDGAEKRRSNGEETRKLYAIILKVDDLSAWQVLCMNCQWGKRKNGGICPHQREKMPRDQKVAIFIF